MKISLLPASKAFIRNKDILISLFNFDWKSEWLNFFSSTDVLAFYNARTALYFLLRKTKSTNKNEVIISAYTCTTVAESVQAAGYKVVYCDIDFDSGIMSTNFLSKLINSRTHSIITANTYGAIDNVVDIQRMVKGKDIYLFEDITWAIGGFFSNKPIGSFGDAAFVSLGLGKNITVGSGGILLINSNKIKTSIKKGKKIISAPLLSPLSFVKTLFYNVLTNKYVYKILNVMQLTPSDAVESIDKDKLLSCHEMSRYRKKLSSNTLASYIKIKVKKKPILHDKLLSKRSIFINQIPTYSCGFNYSSRLPLLLKDNVNQEDFIEHMYNNGFQVTKGFYHNKKNLNPILHKNAIKYCDTMVTIPSHYDMKKIDLNNMVGLM